MSTPSTRFTIERRRDYYVVDNTDGQVAETDFETRAEATQWIKEYTTRTGRFAPAPRLLQVARLAVRLPKNSA